MYMQTLPRNLSMNFFGVVDGVFGNLNHHVLLAHEGLAAEA
jgi:hypothetical protein